MSDSNRSYENIKKDYDLDGFVILRSYFKIAEIQELREHVSPHAESFYKANAGLLHYPNVLKSLHRDDDWFRRELENGKHLSLMRFLVGDDVHGASAALFDRPEGAACGIEPHMDAIGREKLARLGATLWVPLDSVTSSNGCLHYLRGSHLKHFPNKIPIPDINLDGDDVFAAELAVGDVVVHSALTVHWSGLNTTTQARRAISYFYFSADDQGLVHSDRNGPRSNFE